MCLREIGICAQITLTILSSIEDDSDHSSEDDYGDLDDHLMSMRIFAMIVNKMFI
jgi:hypothetical protein